MLVVASIVRAPAVSMSTSLGNVDEGEAETDGDASAVGVPVGDATALGTAEDPTGVAGMTADPQPTARAANRQTWSAKRSLTEPPPASE
jgi:hypothetical protein